MVWPREVYFMIAVAKPCLYPIEWTIIKSNIGGGGGQSSVGKLSASNAWDSVQIQVGG